MEINKSKAFKKFKVNFPTIIDQNSKGHRLFFPYDELKEEQIIALKPGCTCTANLSWDKNGVRAVYNDTTKDETFTEGPTKTLTKSIQVFLDEGPENLMVLNEHGVEIYNQKKSNITLFFNITVRKG